MSKKTYTITEIQEAKKLFFEKIKPMTICSTEAIKIEVDCQSLLPIKYLKDNKEKIVAYHIANSGTTGNAILCTIAIVRKDKNEHDIDIFNIYSKGINQKGNLECCQWHHFKDIDKKRTIINSESKNELMATNAIYDINEWIQFNPKLLEYHTKSFNDLSELGIFTIND
jgi:hypothetical protein